MKTYLLLFLCLIIFNCSNSDDTTEVPKTFLELYGGTEWIDADISTTVVYQIIRFINNTNTPYEDFYYYNEYDCALYYLIDVRTFDILIVDNSDQLVIVHDKETISELTDTFKITGETMTLIQKDSNGEETFTYKKYNQNVDDLNICN